MLCALKMVVPLVIVVGLLGCAHVALSSPLKYPATRQVDQVDDYHGVKVGDPYRWLEDDNSDETKAWVTSQNQVTEQYLGKAPARPLIRSRLTKLWNFALLTIRDCSLVFSR